MKHSKVKQNKQTNKQQKNPQQIRIGQTNETEGKESKQKHIDAETHTFPHTEESHKSANQEDIIYTHFLFTSGNQLKIALD